MSMSSSPDPLCLVTSSPSKSDPDLRALKRSSKPLAYRSPNLPSSDLFALSSTLSPSKSITMTTPKGKDRSPWRIKVTVEAEPGDSQDENSMSSPTSKRSTRIISQTTSVPLNDTESQSPVKRRGRPRKSDTAPVTNAQTKSIPLNDGSSPARRRGRPRKSDTVPALASQVEAAAEIETGASSPTKRRGRPRKSDATKESPKPRTRTPGRRPRRSIVRSPEGSEESSAEDPSYKPPPRTHNRGDGQVPEPILSDAMYDPRSPPSPHALPNVGNDAPHTRRSTRTTRRSVREQRRTRNSDVFSALPDAHSYDSEDQEGRDVQDDQEATPRAASSQSHDDASMWQSMISHQNNNQHVPSEENESSEDDLDTVGPDETGDTTMLHSEEFSMVSLDSLPSMQVAREPYQDEIPEPNPPTHAKPPVFGTDPVPRRRAHIASRNAISSPIPDVNDSVASFSYMPSSPPVRFPVRTPSGNQKLKSPSVPPAVGNAHLSPTTADTPKLLNVVSAGRALQGVLGGSEEETSARRESVDSSAGSQPQPTESNVRSTEFQASSRQGLNSHFGDQLNESTRSMRQGDFSKASTPHGAAKNNDTTVSDGSVFDGPRTISAQNSSSHHRLPTPEESQSYSLNSPPPPVSQLVTEQSALEPAAQPTQLISPARSQQSQNSEDDSGAQTPESAGGDQQEGEQTSSELPSSVDSSLSQKPGENFDAYWQRRREAISRRIAESGPEKVLVISSEASIESDESSELPQNQEGTKSLGDDIWEEEASRSSETRTAARLQRREMRNKSAEQSQNSSILSTSSHGHEDSSGRIPQSSDRGSSSRQDQAAPLSSGSRAQKLSNRECSAPRSSQRTRQGDFSSDANESDNTGLFWRESSEPRPPHESGQTGREQGLSAILDQIHTPQDQTPRATPQKAPVFKAPYNMGGGFNSPVRSSPLRQQVMFSSPSAVNSSPYQKNQMTVENSMIDESVVEEPEPEPSETSDIKQLRKELSARRRSSGAFENRRMSQRFDDEDEQVERQIEEERTQKLFLDQSTANPSKDHSAPSVVSVVHTQQSRTSSARSSVQSKSGGVSRPRISLFDGPVPRLAPGPVRPNGDDTLRSVDTTHDDSMEIDGEGYSQSSARQDHSHMMSLNMNRPYPRLFEEQNSLDSQGQEKLHSPPSTTTQPEPQSVPPLPQQQQGGGLFGRIWSSIAPFQQESKPAGPTQPVAAPQIIQQTSPTPSTGREPTLLPKPTRLRNHKDLPKLKPFSKTHFLTLHHIWSRYLTHPAEFSLSHTSNQRLVAQPVFNDSPTPIPGVHGQPSFLPLAVYFDISFRNRGYKVKFPEELIVVAALFMTLLRLDDEAAYTARYGEALRWEEVRKKGEGRIGGFEVIQRLGFLEVGRIIRRHEALGKPVSTIGGAYVRWPVATPGPGWVPLPR